MIEPLIAALPDEARDARVSGLFNESGVNPTTTAGNALLQSLPRWSRNLSLRVLALLRHVPSHDPGWTWRFTQLSADYAGRMDLSTARDLEAFIQAGYGDAYQGSGMENFAATLHFRRDMHQALKENRR